MYLDFIIDIAKVGDKIRIVCKDESIEGTIVKISSTMLALKKNDGALILKKDDEITDIILKPLDVDSANVSLPINQHASSPQTDDFDNEANRTTDFKEDNDSPHLITMGNYDTSWDTIDRDNLLRNANRIKHSLNKTVLDSIITGNANVIEVLKRTFRVSTNQRNKLSVPVRTIIETELFNDLTKFNIGDSLPIIIYYHEKLELSSVFLTLSPNTVGGFIDLLIQAIKEEHYKETKSLCYFLLSIIHVPKVRKIIFFLLQLLKPVNAFEKNKVKINGSGKTPKDYKEIEKQLNELISSGLHIEAISLIDSVLLTHNLDDKYKSSLLLRKAQAYSSIKDYEHARLAYNELVQFKEKTGGDPKNLSHLYTELARLQAIDKSSYESARLSAEKALTYNPQNKYAATLLEQLKSGTFNAVLISSIGPTETDTPEEDKELILDSDDSAFVVSKMIGIDIKEHKYSNDIIIANGGVSSSSIADSIFQEAKQYKGVDLGERYPIYLEAAKAYSELPVGSYDLSNYMEAVAFYAVYKGNFLFTKFNNDIKSGKVLNLLYLKRLRDSACSYYIESLNLLSNTRADILSLILCNYIKLNVSIINLEQHNEVDLSGNFNKVFLSCINSKDQQINEVVWKTIVIIGAASSNAWNHLWKYRKYVSWRVEFKKALNDNNKRPEIYRTINSQNKSKIDESLSPGSFLKKALSYRQQRITQIAELFSKILKDELNLHLLSSLEEIWNQLIDYTDLFSETEIETKYAIDKILLILKPYSNRNQVERTNILIQVQREIDKQITFINDNTTFYGRTFFFPLLIKWKQTITNLLAKKIADTLPQLLVLADPPYIVHNNPKQVVNLIIKNVGESTAEGCIMLPTIEDVDSGESIKGKNSYKNEIPAGSNLDVPMNLPPQMCRANSIKLSMSISAIYQGKELPPKEFNFTIEREPESSITYNDIPWKDGPIPAEHMFKGRQKLLNELKRHYTSIERDKPYILYGLTRTGKSSILKYLGISLNKKEVLIDNTPYTIATFDWDLSQASSFGNAQDMWEYLLKEQLFENLSNYLSVDDLQALSMPEKPRAKDLSNALRYLKKMNLYPIFLVDEFSYIKGLIDNNTVNPAFLHTLRKFSLEGLASFIYAGTYDIKALLKDKKYGITGQLVNAIEQQIAEIDPSSAEELINALGSKLRFTPEAITHIHKLSGDVPYFVQMICKYCGIYAVEKKRSIIGYPELEYIIRVLTGEIETDQGSMVKTLPENVFQNNMFSPADPIEVKVLISSITYINRNNRENPRGVGVEELQELWAAKNIEAYRPMLAESIELLSQKKVLLQQEDEGLPVYKISVDLFRRWWAVHNPDINLQLDQVL